MIMSSFTDLKCVGLFVQTWRPRVNKKQVEAASNMINKLKIGFDSENFRNPFLARYFDANTKEVGATILMSIPLAIMANDCGPVE